ncbi:JmjC domain-containing protein [Colletotrichum musicola]|uniref:JmjC domain-containing protein n=1 Tax=Colletotrichum musicola TaxID=2175873 RepID=A0A8H6K1D6_9PEZI|nr:JmjC domain-containing protein [Colletotrichum musicola]
MRLRLARWRQQLRATSRQTRNYSTVRPADATATPFESVDVQEFRRSAFQAEKPLVLRRPGNLIGQSFLPAASKWFKRDEVLQLPDPHQSQSATFAPYMYRFAHHIFPYELMSPQFSEDTESVVDTTSQFLTWLASDPDPLGAVLAGIVHAASPPSALEPRFSSFGAPLLLLLKATEFNRLRERNVRQLYIAQAQLPDLPQQLQDDLPVPRIVREAGKGDIYNSSIWLGLEPTYTPLHRDPNPNLFCQLLGHKVVRLLPPSSGDHLYRRVQMQIRESGNSRIRTSGMMEGRERVVMNTAVWGAEIPEDIIEARLSPGDALYIPTGWWHSVKSGHHDGQLNASVNWWFR